MKAPDTTPQSGREPAPGASGTPAADAQKDARDMARLAGGQGAALNDLMERHAEKLFHYLNRALQDEDDAADLTQETFVRVYQNRERFDPRKKFSTWLYAIASNLVRDRYRWRTRHPKLSLDSVNTATANSYLETLAESRPSPSETVQVRERVEAVRSAVAALPENLRLPLILSEYEEKSHAEIGEILRCSAKAVETRLYRARHQLRLNLGRWMESL